jgi:hypothetical protein
MPHQSPLNNSALGNNHDSWIPANVKHLKVAVTDLQLGPSLILSYVILAMPPTGGPKYRGLAYKSPASYIFI